MTRVKPKVSKPPSSKEDMVGDSGDMMQESSAESDMDDHVRKNVVG